MNCRWSGALALLALLSLPGCAESRDDGSLKVALILAGPENDEGWNQSAYEGLQRIKRELSARTRKVTARSANEIRSALLQAAEQDFDLIIGHGFEFNAPAFEIAASYPRIAFVTTGGTQSAANLATIVLRLEEASYSLGILAGHLTKSGVVSAISGEAYEPVERVVRGFVAGLQSVQADARVLVDYLGSWEDVARAKEKAFAHADAGADVFFQNADAAGIGIFEACRARKLPAFGCNRDQANKAPDVILASAVADIEATFLLLATEVAEGRFRGGERSFGTAEGETRVVFNPALAARIPAEARAQMEAAHKALAEDRTYWQE